MENPVEHKNLSNSAAQDVINVSGYRFVELNDLPALQAKMIADFKEIDIKGTILLADEGINAALAGTREQIEAIKAWFENDTRFANLWLKESESQILPFSKLKVRVRPEIITFESDPQKRVSPALNPAPEMNPTQLKQWLDEKENFTLLDTRNSYETASGTFSEALDLKLNTFKQFGHAVEAALERGELDRNKPVVTFCTGGIRCEKAAPYLIENGFKEVYQVKGGILNYFEQCGGEHWDGNCFVFDDRAEINPALEPTGARMCEGCNLAVPADKSSCDCGAVIHA